MPNGDELFETSLRDQERQREFHKRHKRIAGLKHKPMTVRDTLASGGEGRLYTSKAGDGETGVTRAINPDQVTDGVTEIEAARVFAVEETLREAHAASQEPVPSYAVPLGPEDARAYVNLDEAFPTTDDFHRFAQENELTDEDVRNLANVAQRQRVNRQQLAELHRLVPSFSRDLPALVDYLKRTRGLTDAHLRVAFSAPSAVQFHGYWEQWQNSLRQAAGARAARSGRPSDAGEYIATLIADEPEPSPRQREETAAMRDGLMGKLKDTYVPGRDVPGERGASLNAAAELFAKTLDLGADDYAGEGDATERSLLG